MTPRPQRSSAKHPVVGLDSYNPKLEVNPNGTVDLYFGPQPPRGHASNWIATTENRLFFVVFRNYAPEKAVLDERRRGRWRISSGSSDRRPIRRRAAGCESHLGRRRRR